MIRFLFALGVSLLLWLLLCGTADARRSSRKHAADDAASTPSATSPSPSTGGEPAAPIAPAAPSTPAPAAQGAVGAATSAHAPMTEPEPTQAPGRLSKPEIDATLVEASALFKAGKHLEAAQKLMLVYDTDPQPLLLFNAGQAYRRARRPQEAKEVYLRFLEAAPNSPLVPEVRGYVRDTDTLIELQAREQQIAIQLEKEKAAATSAQQALQKERSAPIYRRSWFWVGIGAVGLAIIGGGTAGLFIRERTKADAQVEIVK
jgi:tetratricopeptide (TPR) repeat protein